ncbi:MAG: hypothetical protein LBT47_02280 [Deltaproteobacteria bacterium]|nr:hypothetical protein [Deltaproteobacteria bacterium]
MFRIFCVVLSLLIMTSAALAAEPGPDRDLGYMALSPKSVRFDAQAPSAGEMPGLIISIIPEFYYGRSEARTTTLSGVPLSAGSGTNKGFGITFLATKPLSELFTLSFIYQWAYSDYNGGELFPTALAPLYLKADQRAYSNMAGLIGTFNLGTYGRLETSFLQGWDSYDGSLLLYNQDGTLLATTPPDIDDDRASSLMAWYTLDVPVTDSLALTPYLGWRSVYVVLNNNGQSVNHAWAHLLSGGLSLKYSNGPLALIFRGGFNHRVSSDDIPGLSSRAVAPGVTHFGWNTSFSRTVGTFGLAVDYAFGPGLLELSYDAMVGSDAAHHKGAAVLVFFF